MKTKIAQALGLTAAFIAASSFAQTIKVAQVVELSGGSPLAKSMPLAASWARKLRRQKWTLNRSPPSPKR
jgi:hypothetical protein